MYVSTKKYGHERGLSSAFRQWKAKSHCNTLHGYALAVEFIFESESLDGRNWVIDFGSLKPLKSWLDMEFDHRTLVAEDDPELSTFKDLHYKGIIDINVLPDVGCEKFAEYIFNHTDEWLKQTVRRDVIIRSVQVWEHESNSARYER